MVNIVRNKINKSLINKGVDGGEKGCVSRALSLFCLCFASALPLFFLCSICTLCTFYSYLAGGGRG